MAGVGGILCMIKLAYKYSEMGKPERVAFRILDTKKVHITTQKARANFRQYIFLLLFI
jgi:hypothetical protein